ncbi:hypothetical protein AALP_AAs67696U000800 [Arabis alpina]|uniref:Uncharacterized protein n=1 Tax=Arabis alpina TaxID=50452 RepID=A0A087G0W6_ARAAL|nr:hypothetical protein AALP_AAs67696U000800 [Arabis alpina]
MSGDETLTPPIANAAGTENNPANGDDSREGTKSTPFTTRIVNTPVKPNAKIQIALYEGKFDPTQHLTVINIAMGRARFPPEEKEADDAAIDALQKALLLMSLFQNELTINRHATLEDALDKVSSFMELEEDQQKLKEGDKPSRGMKGQRFQISDDAEDPAQKNGLRITDPCSPELV